MAAGRIGRQSGLVVIVLRDEYPPSFGPDPKLGIDVVDDQESHNHF